MDSNSTPNKDIKTPSPSVIDKPEPIDKGQTKSGEKKDHHHEKINHGGMIVYFIIFTLCLGAVLKEVRKKTNIPYTPMVLILGLILGFFSHRLYFLGECIDLANNIDPHALLMIFIPGLVFEGAYNTDPYVFGKSKWQILIMAGPGIILVSYVLAWSFTDLFKYTTISFNEALLVGSILSTTDPVAVVALLKELGASTRFKTILEGESLLNDGTAYVFFLICLNIVVYKKIDYQETVVQFFQLSFGGPLLGILIGMIISFWIGKVRKDSTLVSILTFISCYSCFFFAENYLGVSGILGVVSLGVYLSSFTKLNLSHEMNHSLEIVWSFSGFLLETLIFLISGTYIGAQYSDLSKLTLTRTDLWKALLFQPYLILVRYVTILIQLPFLNSVGYKISNLSAFILSYGGLRGAIALSLAMIVAIDTRLS